MRVTLNSPVSGYLHRGHHKTAEIIVWNGAQGSVVQDSDSTLAGTVRVRFDDCPSAIIEVPSHWLTVED